MAKVGILMGSDSDLPVMKKAADMLVGKWVKCDNCKEILYKEDVHNNLNVCPNCGNILEYQLEEEYTK